MVEASGGVLDSIGRTLLAVVDLRVWSLVSVPVLLVLAWLNRKRNRVWPDMTAWLLAAMGSLMMYTGFNVFCVFILTRPIYLEALSADTFTLTAFVTSIVTFFLGGREVLKLWRVPEEKKDAKPPTNL